MPRVQAAVYTGVGLAVVFGLVVMNLMWRWADRQYVLCSVRLDNWTDLTVQDLEATETPAVSTAWWPLSSAADSGGKKAAPGNLPFTMIPPNPPNRAKSIISTTTGCKTGGTKSELT